MTIEEIQTQLSELVAAMVGKGVVLPHAEFKIKPSDMRIYLKTYHDDHRPFSSKDVAAFAFCKGNTPAECFDAAWNVVLALPSPEQALLDRHMRRLADAVVLARADNVPDEYVAPVSMTVKAMSDNLLTEVTE